VPDDLALSGVELSACVAQGEVDHRCGDPSAAVRAGVVQESVFRLEDAGAGVALAAVSAEDQLTIVPL
jgi:hypothetical protein